MTKQNSDAGSGKANSNAMRATTIAAGAAIGSAAIAAAVLFAVRRRATGPDPKTASSDRMPPETD